MDQDNLNDLIQHQAYLYRLSSSEVVTLLKAFDSNTSQMLSQLRDLLDDLSDAEKTALMSGQYTTNNLKDIQTLIQEWQQKVSTVLLDGFNVSATALAIYEAQYIARKFADQVIKADGKALMSQVQNTPLTGGTLVDSLFSKITDDTRLKVENVIRDGINQGQTNQQIMQRIRGTKQFNYQDGLLNQSRNSIDVMVRTARSHVSNVTYVSTFEALGAKYLKFVSVLDSRTSKICASLDGTIWKVGDPDIRKPPLHPHCRSILVGVDASGETIGQRPSNNGKDIKTVDSNTSFKEWFADQDETFQKNWLGPARYKLYKDGKYSLDKFVDPLSGQVFTLKELEILDNS
ncbi:minor capsid protein [Acinetobacter pollinis]|uniref:minor capsid protein n=1 Tax=Acinetobacter pollinis TaxID=2605270 RepID=UPI0018C21118|nr:minor capsid protein [Acinetobacter pollinis]MBF7694033.1 minor capsid protein [Acinetobacter pollinis]MBF7701662.1 minor capsid protein [Acinetobacter pollinis]